MQIPRRKSEQESRAKRTTDHYLTPEAVERLRRTLDDLVHRQRPLAAEETRRMADMGDRSENAGYTSAKAMLTRINNRIVSIEERLKHAIVIERGADRDGCVRIGSMVVVSIDGRERTFEVLGSQEVSPGRGRISYRSPLGAALIGHRVGDCVTITVSEKEKMYRIVRIS
ncbi:MAG: GreA/GreB family elongation factor [Candidatus Uhrbacteria bacterium]